MQSKLFQILDVQLRIRVPAVWADLSGNFELVAGYTSFGDLILQNPQTGEYAILLVNHGEIEPTGLTDVDMLTDSILSDPDVVEHLLKPTLLNDVEARLGKLDFEEVYFPVPYPFLGGSGAPSTYEKGSVWIYVDLVGQSQA